MPLYGNLVVMVKSKVFLQALTKKMEVAMKERWASAHNSTVLSMFVTLKQTLSRSAAS